MAHFQIEALTSSALATLEAMTPDTAAQIVKQWIDALLARFPLPLGDSGDSTTVISCSVISLDRVGMLPLKTSIQFTDSEPQRSQTAQQTTETDVIGEIDGPTEAAKRGIQAGDEEKMKLADSLRQLRVEIEAEADRQ